ncbi:MAG: hypothetical protein IPM24_01510 [Bryobacterales bacterium]|nr:hypothetical protein [Bryobacterales bacterium]
MTLSAFDPLPRVLFADDFDNGLNGWITVIGNYEDSLDSIIPEYQGWQAPMLSNLTMWDTGTAGSLNGVYAMKLATRPREASIAHAMKRLTSRRAVRVRIEYYFAFKPEPSRMRLLDTDVRCVGFGFDIQQSVRAAEPRYRTHPMVRYLNCWQGDRVRRWQYRDTHESFRDIGGRKEMVSFCPYTSRDWKDLPGAEQPLCYNEIPTKVNWHYFSLDFDLATASYMRMQCNDHEFDLRSIPPIRIPAMPNLWCMLQPLVWVESDTGNRAFLYIDSAVLSAEAL